MAKPTAPLLAFDASGTIAKTMVYASWRGRSYVRRWVSPAQPRTSAQLETRHTFSFLTAVYKRASSTFTAPWVAGAKGRPLTDRNLFIKINNGPLISQSSLADFTFSPGALGGLPPASIAITPGSGSLAVAVTAPASPTGWTIAMAVAAAIRDQDPQSGILYTITTGTDNVSPYSITLSGLTGSELYQVGAWLVWTKPDGSTAYSVSTQSSGTPS